MTYELLAFNTDMRYLSDIRYRRYTTSKKRAQQFGKIPKIQFSDSGHGIVFSAREHKGTKKVSVYELDSYVLKELGKIADTDKVEKEKARKLKPSSREICKRIKLARNRFRNGQYDDGATILDQLILSLGGEK